VVATCLACASGAAAADQTVPGTGNSTAVALANASPIVRSAVDALVSHVEQISDHKLRGITLDAVTNPATCVTHRASVDDSTKNRISGAMKPAGLWIRADEAPSPGGLKAGFFPAVLNDGTKCPPLPQPFISAPGSVFGGHHSYPGGLPVHESFNLESSLA